MAPATAAPCGSGSRYCQARSGLVTSSVSHSLSCGRGPAFHVPTVRAAARFTPPPHRSPRTPRARRWSEPTPCRGGPRCAGLGERTTACPSATRVGRDDAHRAHGVSVGLPPKETSGDCSIRSESYGGILVDLMLPAVDDWFRRALVAQPQLTDKHVVIITAADLIPQLLKAQLAMEFVAVTGCGLRTFR